MVPRPAARRSPTTVCRRRSTGRPARSAARVALAGGGAAFRPADAVGLHTGECEVDGPRMRGPAVDLATRLSQVAQPGEVLVSRTVSDLVAGSGLAFDPRGGASSATTASAGTSSRRSHRTGRPASRHARIVLASSQPLPIPYPALRIASAFVPLRQVRTPPRASTDGRPALLRRTAIEEGCVGVWQRLIVCGVDGRPARRNAPAAAAWQDVPETVVANDNTRAGRCRSTTASCRDPAARGGGTWRPEGRRTGAGHRGVRSRRRGVDRAGAAHSRHRRGDARGVDSQRSEGAAPRPWSLCAATAAPARHSTCRLVRRATCDSPAAGPAPITTGPRASAHPCRSGSWPER